MQFPRYWAKGSFTGRNPDGKEITISAYGWSATSREEAEQLGGERARRVVERGFARIGPRDSEYEYGSSPLREEVIKRIDHGGREIGVITRNRYGALVLNTAGAMFVDIDFPEVNKYIVSDTNGTGIRGLIAVIM